MSFSNTQYLYDHLPGRYRRDDIDLFLKRFLQWFGETLDGWDETFDSFDESIDPETAAEIWLRFWLLQLFGWAWFPWWFTLTDIGRVYGNFAGHLARRGTRRGIERFLRDFGIVARVHTKSQPWGEFFWGDTVLGSSRPLSFVIEIRRITGANQDVCVWGEATWGESFYAAPRRLFTEREIIDLVRYQQPQAQQIVVVWRFNRIDTFIAEEDGLYWQQVSW